MSDIEDDSFADAGLFEEPKDFYKPLPPPTVATFERTAAYVRPGEPSTLDVHLVGSSPLWGHLLWNAGKATTDYIDKNREDLVTDKTVLELGAGAGLPSLVASLSARHTVITDYPDPDLVANLELNRTSAGLSQEHQDRISVQGYIWGDSVDELVNLPLQKDEKFDFMILSDLVFNHTEHTKLLKTCDLALKPDTGRVLVVFSPHRPWLFNDDMAFFKQAEEEFGYSIIDKFELDYKPMFEEDEETKELRGKVFGFLLKK